MPGSQFKPLLIGALALLLNACASGPGAQRGEVEDPVPAPELADAVPEATVIEALSHVGDEPADAAADAAYADIWARIRAGYGLPACDADESSRRWATWYAERPDYMDRVFTRAEPWLHFIVEEAEARDMPLELVLLPVVESAFDPFAYSHARAMGAWQFIASTGRQYGLQQSWWHDGRRDVVTATRAALDHLGDLSAMFDGDWLLALAAYNAGAGRVQRAIRRQQRRGGATDYWSLTLPRETRGYVPKLEGVACLVAYPERYEFELPPIADEAVIRVLDPGQQMDLVLAAQLAEVEIAELFALNPGYNRWATAPEGPSHLVLPIAAAERLEQQLATQPNRRLMQWDQVKVERGDTLGRLAARHGVPVNVIRTVNGLRGDRINVDQRLRLPRSDADRPDPLYTAAAEELARLQTRLIAPERIRHRVRAGENLGLIAQRYRVSVGELQRWNGISNPRRLRAGQTLDIFHSPAARGDAGTVNYQVQRGDSLWKIARRYRVSISDLRRWNGLSANAILRPGQSLKVVL